MKRGWMFLLTLAVFFGFSIQSYVAAAGPLSGNLGGDVSSSGISRAIYDVTESLYVSPGSINLNTAYDKISQNSYSVNKFGMLYLYGGCTYELTAKLELDTNFTGIEAVGGLATITQASGYSGTLIEATAKCYKLKNLRIVQAKNAGTAYGLLNNNEDSVSVLPAVKLTQSGSAVTIDTDDTTFVDGIVSADLSGVSPYGRDGFRYDKIYIDGSDAGFVDNWYNIAYAAFDTIIVKDCTKVAAGTYNLTICPNNSLIEDCVFLQTTVSAYTHRYSVFSASQQGGLVVNCHSGQYSWRLAEDKSSWITMVGGSVGEYSIGGDGEVTGGGDPGIGQLLGEYWHVQSHNYCFGGCGSVGIEFAGKMYYCALGDNCGGIGKGFSGLAVGCVGGKNCFGGASSAGIALGRYPSFTGTAYDCVAEGRSFGSGSSAGTGMAGTMVGCRVTEMPAPMYCTGARIENCYIKNIASNVDAINLVGTDPTVIYNSTILVDASGSGVPINGTLDGSILAHGIIAHCRFNNADTDPNGTSDNVYNPIPDGHNLTDDNIE